MKEGRERETRSIEIVVVKTNPWMDGWMDGWMDRLIDGWMDGWM